MTVTCAKAYKRQFGNRLAAVQVQRVVHDVLDAFAKPSGEPCNWTNAVDEAIRWMLNDDTWRSDDVYRGGKLLDDVVDSMICLATALSYVNGCSHVWQHPDHLEDGHIIGPGTVNI
jgi:hypothetical protein